MDTTFKMYLKKFNFKEFSIFFVFIRNEMGKIMRRNNKSVFKIKK